MKTTEKLREIIEWEKGLSELDRVPLIAIQIQQRMILEDVSEAEMTIFNIDTHTNRHFLFAVDWQNNKTTVFYEISEEFSFRIRNIIMAGEIFLKKVEYN